MNYKLIVGKETIFEDAFRQVVAAMENMEGHQETHLFRDIDNAQAYLVVSEWNSREAFDAFVHSDRFKKVTNWGTEQVLAARPVHDVYEK